MEARFYFWGPHFSKFGGDTTFMIGPPTSVVCFRLCGRLRANQKNYVRRSCSRKTTWLHSPMEMRWTA